MRHLPADSSKPARKGTDLSLGDLLAYEQKRRRENFKEDIQMLRGFSGMGSVLQLVY